MDMNLSQLQDIAEGRGAWHAAVHGQQKVRYDLVTEQQQQADWGKRGYVFCFVDIIVRIV